MMREMPARSRAEAMPANSAAVVPRFAATRIAVIAKAVRTP
jgi:hypothetical protein